MNAVLLDGSTIELIEVLARGSHIDVEDIDIRIRVVILCKHCMLRGVHTADLRAVRLATLVRIAGLTGAYALDEYDGLRLLAVGRTEEVTAGRTGSIHETLILEGGHDIRTLGVCIFIVLVDLDHLIAGCHDDGAVVLFYELIGILIVDGLCAADLFAESADALVQLQAIVRVNGSDLRYGLCERNIDAGAGIEAEVELVRYLLLRALLGAETAACALVLIDISCLPLDRHVEVADEALYICDFTIAIDVNLIMLANLNHLRGYDTGRAVECREGLVKLCHLTADGRFCFDNVYIIAGIRDIKCGLHAGDTAADHERTLRNRCGICGKRTVEFNLRNRCFHESDRLFGCDGLVLMHPGALLTDVCDFQHVRVHADIGNRFTEGLFMHTWRAGAYHDAGETVLFHRILDEVLAGLGTHIGIICGEDDTRHMAGCFCYGFHIDSGCDVRTAVADKYTDFLHILFSFPLLRILSECTDDRLLRQIRIKLRRYIIRL